ncbi:MAG: sulfatase-like hydrolase/transferase [Planctomycetota bacterium]|nr:sulfatase-like hydrolase/transferase [Planctomycetota bacterium]
MSLNPSKKHRLAWTVILLTVGLLSAYWFWPRQRFNLLVITLDTTRADRIGCYGYAPALTPVLDDLAAQGGLFERYYTTIPLTLPAHASMFTGLYPPEHGIYTNGKNQLADEVPTLAEVLRKEGYQTGAFVASFVLDSKFGLDQGFQHYGDDLTGAVHTDEALHRSRDGNVVVDEALSWLAEKSQQPFCCWVHLYDPHTPYLDHRDQFGDRFVESPYDAEIAFVDIQIGRLRKFLEEQNLEKQTLVIVIGDHGEGLGEHNERRHGQMLYNTTMHVPWIMSLPQNLPAGVRITDPVSQVDLLPTILDVLRRPASDSVSGLSRLVLINGVPMPARHLYGETEEPLHESGWSPLQSLTTAEWKYIRTTRPELYDLVNDRGETNNLAESQPDMLEQMERQLADLENAMEIRESVDVELTPQEQRKLNSLGYAGSSTDVTNIDDAQSLPDIKDMIVHYNTLDDVHVMMDEGKIEEAISLLEKLIADAPTYDLAKAGLGDAYTRQERYDEAGAIYDNLLKRNPRNALAMFHLGDVRQAQGRLDEAITLYEAALILEPDTPQLHYNLARTFILLGRDDDAIPHLKSALELDPGYVFAHVELGSAVARKGRLVEALVHFERALEYQENSLFAHMNAVGVLAQMGRNAEAIRHLSRAADISPEDAEIQFQLGAFLAAQGDREKALVHLQDALRLQPNREEARELIRKLQRAK